MTIKMILNDNVVTFMLTSIALGHSEFGCNVYDVSLYHYHVTLNYLRDADMTSGVMI